MKFFWKVIVENCILGVIAAFCVIMIANNLALVLNINFVQKSYIKIPTMVITSLLWMSVTIYGWRRKIEMNEENILTVIFVTIVTIITILGIFEPKVAKIAQMANSILLGVFLFVIIKEFSEELKNPAT